MNKYNKAMEHVTVSGDMKDRIIDNIKSGDLKKGKIVRFPNVKKYVAFAACLAVILIGVFIVSSQINKPKIVPEPLETGGVDGIYGIKEYKNAKTLSEASGINIEDLNNLPFKVSETVYNDHENNLVEIVYSDANQNLYYRVSKGSEDNSGDYNEYSKVYTKDINGITVTLKGDKELIYLVLYEKDGCSYSIGASNGLTEQQIEKMI